MAIALFLVMPKLLSTEAAKILKPNRIFAVGLIIAFLVFGYFVYAAYKFRLLG